MGTGFPNGRRIRNGSVQLTPLPNDCLFVGYRPYLDPLLIADVPGTSAATVGRTVLRRTSCLRTQLECGIGTTVQNLFGGPALGPHAQLPIRPTLETPIISCESMLSLVSPVGIEPTTPRLKVSCSTN